MKETVKKIVPYSNILSIVLVVMVCSSIVFDLYLVMIGVGLVMLYELYYIYINRKFMNLITINHTDLFIVFVKRYVPIVILISIGSFYNLFFYVRFYAVDDFFVSIGLMTLIGFNACFFVIEYIYSANKKELYIKYTIIFIFNFMAWFGYLWYVGRIFTGISLLIINYKYINNKLFKLNDVYSEVVVITTLLVMANLVLDSSKLSWYLESKENIRAVIHIIGLSISFYIVMDIYHYLYEVIESRKCKLIGFIIVLLVCIFNVYTSGEYGFSLIPLVLFGLPILYIMNFKLSHRFVKIYKEWL